MYECEHASLYNLVVLTGCRFRPPSGLLGLCWLMGIVCTEAVMPCQRRVLEDVYCIQPVGAGGCHTNG